MQRDPSAAGSTQADQVSTTPETLADVFGQRANVSAFAAAHIQFDHTILAAQDVNGMNPDLARSALDLDTFASILVQGSPLVLQGGMHRWNLFNVTEKCIACSANRRQVHHLSRHRAGLNNFTFSVACGRCLPELEGGGVTLVGIERDLGKLRRCAKTQRQQTSGQWVKRAGVARFFCTHQPTHLLQCVIAGEPQGLVQQDDAVQLTAWLTRRLAHEAAPSSSASLALSATARLIRALNSAARSVVRSKWKCKVGTV